MKNVLFSYIFFIKITLLTFAITPDIATVHFEVKDERGIPVSNINIKVSTLATYMGRFVGSPKMQTFSLLSDTNGVATCIYPCYDSHGHYMVFSDNYYFESGDYSFKARLSSRSAISLNIVDKREMGVPVKVWRRRNPIPMYYADSLRIRLPSDQGAWGFDLKKADWVTPYGIGENADFVFEINLRKEGEVMSVIGAIVFAENDGFYEHDMMASRTFRSTYSADPNAKYANRREFFESNGNGKMRQPILEEKKYIVMRTRTRVDAEGNVTHANYSQIYGPVRIKNMELFIPAIFFNHNPNDVNLEFDFKNNLFPKKRR